MAGKRQPIRHGTTGGFRAHFRHGEPMCDPCRDADRERRGVKKRVLLPCGTQGAYARHLNRNEEPCEPCRAANLEKTNRFRENNKPEPDDPRHGSLNFYNNYGCRCNECRVANSGQSAKRRARQRLKSPRPS